MKRIGFLIVLGLILAFKLEAKKIQGKIIFDHDTIEVTLNIPIKFLLQEPNFEKLQYKVKYFDSSGKKITVKPDDAKEFQFKYDNEIIRMVSRRGSPYWGSILSSSKIFLRLRVDGYLKLFHYYRSQSSPGYYNQSTGLMTGGYTYQTENFVLQKGNGELIKPSGLTFKKDMSEYFRDCPKLADKIRSKIYRKKDLEAIVRFYNSYCK